MKAHFSKWSLFLNILLNQQQRNPPQSCTYARIQLIVVCPQRTNERCLQLSCGGSFIVLCHSWWSPVPPGCNRLICCLRTGVMHGCPLRMKEASAANAFKVMHLSSLRTFVDWPEEWWTPHSSCSTDPSTCISCSSKPASAPVSLLKCMNCLQFYFFHSHLHMSAYSDT